ncbi:MAG: tetratricopeptide repeat protein [Methanothrix sp.]|nr:tetratricopeptide repeat protein [Methanothrix sp.]
MAKQNPEAFDSDLAGTLNNLGILYSDLKDFKRAEEHYKRALTLCEELAKQNPEAFDSDLAGTLNNLGILCSDLSDFERAECYLRKSLHLYKVLATRNPDAFNPDLSEALNDCGNLYRDIDQPEKAKQFYKEALAIVHVLVMRRSKAFEHLLVRIKADMARLYIESGREKEGIDCLCNCLEKKDLLPDLGARSFVALGAAQEKLQNPREASENYLLASSTYFILSRKGVRCFDDVMENLRKAKDSGSEETKSDVEMILSAMQDLDGTTIKVQQSRISERGMMLKSAFEGKKPELKPKQDSIIDEMISILASDLLAKSAKGFESS